MKVIAFNGSPRKDGNTFLLISHAFAALEAEGIKTELIHAFDTINHFFLINEMIIPGSSYWNVGVGREKGEVEKDEEGVATMTTLGRNMAWLLKKL